MQFNQAPAPRESSLGDAYDPTADYAVDDLCIHDNVLCKCITPISGGEAWNPEHWAETNIGDEIRTLNSKITLKSMTAQTDSSGNIALNGFRPIIAVYSESKVIPYIFWFDGKTVFKINDLNLQPIANTSVSFDYIEL